MMTRGPLQGLLMNRSGRYLTQGLRVDLVVGAPFPLRQILVGVSASAVMLDHMSVLGMAIAAAGPNPWVLPAHGAVVAWLRAQRVRRAYHLLDIKIIA